MHQNICLGHTYLNSWGSQCHICKIRAYGYQYEGLEKECCWSCWNRI